MGASDTVVQETRQKLEMAANGSGGMDRHYALSV